MTEGDYSYTQPQIHRDKGLRQRVPKMNEPQRRRHKAVLLVLSTDGDERRIHRNRVRGQGNRPLAVFLFDDAVTRISDSGSQTVLEIGIELPDCDGFVRRRQHISVGKDSPDKRAAVREGIREVAQLPLYRQRK